MSRRLALGVVALVASLGLTRGTSSASGVMPGRGPIELTPPPGAVVAVDEADLVKLVAEGPDEIWLSAKTYRTALTIKRPVALHGMRGATLVGPGQGTVVRIEADSVLVDNLIVRGSGNNFVGEDAAVRAKGVGVVVRHVSSEDNLFGVAFEACSKCVLEDSYVRGADTHLSLRGDGVKLWEAHDSIVRRNHLERVRDMVVWYSRRVVCEDNLVQHSRYGTHFMYAHDGVARRSRLLDDVVGVFVMYSSRLRVENNVLGGAHGAAGVGLGFKESDGVVVTDNAIVGNTSGIYLDNTPRNPREKVVFSGNLIGVNELALRVHGAALGITFVHNVFRQNADLVEVDGNNDVTKLDFHENQWSDYAGYDLDDDGFGDVPFTWDRLSTAVVQESASVRFFHGTVALQMVDLVAKAFPLLARKPVLVDPRPAMHLKGGPS